MIYPTQYRTTERDALSEMNRLNRMMDRLFGEAANGSEAYPPLNIQASEDEAVITAEVPGFELEKLNITVKTNYVTLEGSREAPEFGEDVTVHRCERGSGRFIRSVPLPYELDNSKVTATYKNGILRIILPRAEQSRPRQIEISAE